MGTRAAAAPGGAAAGLTRLEDTVVAVREGRRSGRGAGGRWPAVVALALMLAFTVALLRWGLSLQSAVVAGVALAAAAARLIPAGARRRRGE